MPGNVSAPVRPVAAPEVAWTVTSLPCDLGILTGCFEPTLRAHGETWFVTTHNPQNLHRLDNATATPLPDPAEGGIATAAPGIADQSDVILDIDPQGRLWYSSLALSRGNVLVARSDDGGDTWPLVRTISIDPEGLAPMGADRQWIGFHPDGRVVMTCNCPARAPTFMAWSSDDGASWSAATATDIAFHQGPAGPPHFRADGTLLVPYIYGGFGAETNAIAVAVSSDDGASFETILMPETPHGYLCCAWPNLAETAEGTLWLTWASSSGPMIARSTDGATWTAPELAVESPGMVYPHPGIVAWEGGVILSWFDADGPGHRVARIEPDGRTAVWNATAAPFPSSDYGSVAVAADGRVGVPWLDNGLHMSFSDGPLHIP